MCNNLKSKSTPQLKGVKLAQKGSSCEKLLHFCSSFYQDWSKNNNITVPYVWISPNSSICYNLKHFNFSLKSVIKNCFLTRSLGLPMRNTVDCCLFTLVNKCSHVMTMWAGEKVYMCFYGENLYVCMKEVAETEVPLTWEELLSNYIKCPKTLNQEQWLLVDQYREERSLGDADSLKVCLLCSGEIFLDCRTVVGPPFGVPSVLFIVLMKRITRPKIIVNGGPLGPLGIRR